MFKIFIQSFFWGVVGSLLILFAVGATAFGAAHLYFQMRVPIFGGENVISIEAGELLSAFARDEAIATNRFDGEWLKISSRIFPAQTETVGRGVVIYLRPTDYDSGRVFNDLRRIKCFLSGTGEEQYYSQFQSGNSRRVVNVIGTFLRNGSYLTFEGCQFN
jgi:hypothetical protein